MNKMPIYPLAGIDNASERDDALQVRGDSPRTFVRDAVNVNISDTGRASMRAGLRQVASAPLRDLWQSPLHKDVFAALGDQWCLVNTEDWSTIDLCEIGSGPVGHIVLNNMVLAAGERGIFQYDGAQALRLGLDAPPPPLVEASGGALAAGSYGVALAWLRGEMESPLSAMTTCAVGDNGALDVTFPLCTDDTVTRTRLYLTKPDGGELLRGDDYSVGTLQASVPLLPQLGAPAPFRHMQAMPTGKYLSYWRGRLLTATANVLRFSEALAYHIHDPLHGFVQMPQRITFVHPVDGGIWVGQADHVAFLRGGSPAELVLERKTARPPVPGSAVELDAEAAGEISNGGAAVVAWLADNGYCVGTADGGVMETGAGRLRGIAGEASTSIVFAKRLMTAIT